MAGFKFIPLLVLLNHAVADKKQEAEVFLERGKAYLQAGQFADALQQYHSAIDLDPTNYQAYFRRATVLLATGKVKAALPDLDRVVELKPDFVAGRVQRGNLLLKQGKLGDAAKDFSVVLKTDKSNADALAKLEKVKELQEYYDSVDGYLDGGNHEHAEKVLEYLMNDITSDPALHRKRALCKKTRGDVQGAIADIRAVAKLIPDSTEVYLETSRMYYEVGDVENSLGQIRECLKLNPDHKECFPYYKRVKKLAKLREQLSKHAENKKWMDCLAKGQEILKFEPEVDNLQLDVFRVTCKCNREAGHTAEAIQECTQVLQHLNADDLDTLLERGEAYLDMEQYDKAIEDFQQAVNAHQDSRRAKEALQKGQKLQKQAGKKDYYKILGVKRNANKREIEKAYRKLAREWHPDNFQDDEEKKRAEAKFIDIATAKDTLTDPEKRKRFDMGDDPNDPESQHGGQGFHPFHQGFQGFPFGGDGQHFSFKFGGF